MEYFEEEHGPVDADEFEPFRDMFPPAELPFMALRIVATMGENGKPNWHASVRGETRCAVILGHIELFKHWLLTNMAEDDE